MKKLNALDISIIIGVIVASALFGVLYAHTVFGNSQEMQVTLTMTENTDAAKYIKIGDEVWLSDGDAVLGSSSARHIRFIRSAFSAAPYAIQSWEYNNENKKAQSV